MNALTNDQIRTLCPSVFATQPYEGVSEAYRFVPTASMVDILRDTGWHPVRVRSSRSRIEAKQNFVRHMIRFRQEGDLNAAVASEIPEVILTNSHDRSSAFVLHVGMERVCCLNGLTFNTAELQSISVRHSGSRELAAQVIDAAHRVIEATPKAIETAQAWKQIPLTPPQQLAYATAALEVIEQPAITPAQLLAPRRREDMRDDLWTVYNRVQESAIRGGIRTRGSTGRRMTTRAVTAVDRDLKINKALSRLAEEMAKIVS